MTTEIESTVVYDTDATKMDGWMDG